MFKNLSFVFLILFISPRLFVLRFFPSNKSFQLFFFFLSILWVWDVTYHDVLIVWSKRSLGWTEATDLWSSPSLTSKNWIMMITHSPSHPLSLPLSVLTSPHTLSPSLCHTHPNTLSISLSLSLSHTHTEIHARSLSVVAGFSVSVYT